MDSRNEDPSSTTRKIVQPRVVKRQNAPNENERESKRSRSVGEYVGCNSVLSEGKRESVCVRVCVCVCQHSLKNRTVCKGQLCAFVEPSQGGRRFLFLVGRVGGNIGDDCVG